ncbi:MAG: outer-membrane lipoprotein carrier protein LolA [Endomicrobium sp.]|jgi:chaperone LolA|nr:outer-membrane lipoprotein carrier protein LolA [Endomicrobium sp.]
MIRNLSVVTAAKFKFSYVWHLILVLMFFSCNVLAQESNVVVLFDFLARLEQSDKKTNTIKAKFVQTVFFESTGEKQEIVGTVFLKKPDSIYITQRTPQEQRIYINGKTITVYTPNERQAVVDAWKNSVDSDFSPASIVGFGSSWRELKKANDISLEGYDDNHVIIKIQPFKNKNFNAKIYIEKESMRPDRAIVNSEGLKIEIVFKNYIVNSELSVNIFKFKAPNNVEIIKL